MEHKDHLIYEAVFRSSFNSVAPLIASRERMEARMTIACYHDTMKLVERRPNRKANIEGERGANRE